MLILWTLFITAISAHKVYESTEDIGPEAFQNVTTLYPISNNNTFKSTNIYNVAYNKQTDNVTNNKQTDNVTENKLANNDETKTNNDSESKENTSTSKPKLDATIWKVEAAFAESNLDQYEKGNITEEITDKKNDTKEFRPSPHLGSFYDGDSLRATPTPAGFFTPVKKPSSGFVSSSKDELRSSFTKIPKQILQTHKQYPYKFESPILTRTKGTWKNERPDSSREKPDSWHDKPVSWRERPDSWSEKQHSSSEKPDGWREKQHSWRERPDSLESRPTAEIPVKVPAGGFYKYEDPFKEKPGNDDDDFALGFNEDGKDSAIKKHENPWESFLRLVTAFLPVGLIISALTPSIITIENTAPGPHGTYPSNVFRRSDPEAAPPIISERCRRRLLCELRSEKYYKPQNSPPLRVKQCYKIHCEDTEALAKTLQWLLEYRQSVNGHYT